MKTQQEKANEFALSNEEYPSFKNELETVKANCFLAGYKDCQKEYEAKLRWIPIRESIPPLDIYVNLKDHDGCIIAFKFSSAFERTEFLRSSPCESWSVIFL